MKLKKYGITLLIVLALAVALITIPTFATGESGTVIYVADGGTGNGSSTDAPMGDLFAAINALPDEGGTVVVCGNLTVTGTGTHSTTHVWTWTAKTGKIYVTGKYNGQDYNPTITFKGTKNVIEGASAIEFDNLTLDHRATGGSTEFYCGPSVTIGHNMTFLNKGEAIVSGSNGNNGAICFRMGKFTATCADSFLEINSGTISYIQAGNNKQTVTNSTIVVNAGVTVQDMLQCGGTNQKVGSTTITVNGANVNYIYVGGYVDAEAGNVTLKLNNTHVKALYGQRGTAFQQPGGNGKLTGDLNLTLDNVVIDTWNLGGLTVEGQQNLTVKNATDFKVTDPLSGWDSLTLENSTVWVDAAYAGPATFTADADSLLIVDDATVSVPEGALLESAAVVTVDGSTIADLGTAYAALPAKGGIIQLATDVTITLDTAGTTEYYAWPNYFYSGTAKTGPVTITSADPADPAVLMMVSYKATRSVFSFRGVTKFSNVELRAHKNSSGGFQWFAGPSLTFGQGTNITTNNGAAITYANKDTFGVRMGDHNSSFTAANANTKFYMYSGTMNFIQGGSDRNNVGTATIYVGKDATIVDMIQCSGTNKNVTTSNVTIDGATVKQLFLNGYGSATTGTLNLNVRNAAIETIDYHRTTDAAATVTTANVTLDNTTVDTNKIITKDSRITTGNLALKNYNILSVAGGLSGWNSLTLDNAVVYVTGNTYAGPSTVTADANSAILVDKDVYTEVPAIEGVRTAFCDMTHVHNMTYTAAKAPGAFSAGNNAYYTCSGCGKHYNDQLGTTELDYNADIYLAPLGSSALTHHDYTEGNNFSLQTILSSGGSQGAAVYGDLLFKATNTGACSVVDLTTGQTVGSFRFGSYTSTGGDAWSNHANSIMFGATKYDENDPFPLLYVCAGNSGDHITDGQYFGDDTVGSYYGHLAIERIFYDEETGTYSAETVQRVFFNDMANIPVAEGDDLQGNKLSTMRDSTTGQLNYISGNGYDASAGYQKVGWGWPAWFVDSDPTSDTYGKLYIFSVRYRTYSSYEGTMRSFYNLGSDWNYFLEDGTGNAYIFTEFDLPTLPASEEDASYGANVILYPKDIKDQFTTRYTNGATQGGTMYQGRIYYSYGFGGAATDKHNRNYINVIDIAKRDIVAEVPICNDPTTKGHEPECPAIWNGELILSMNPGVYSIGYIALDEPTTEGGVTYIECSLCGHNLKTLGTVAFGDADGDGHVDAFDAAMVVKYSVGAADASQLNLAALDVDGDGFVDAYDAALIQKYSVGAIDKFPVEE